MKSRWIAPLIIGALALVAASIWLAILFGADANSQPAAKGAEPVVTEPQKTTNPDYIFNPSAFLVDYDNKISSRPPINRGLWVEAIVNPYTLRVSYVVEQAGVQIVDFADIHIPGLGLPGLPDDLSPRLYMDHWGTTRIGKCWTDAADGFLTQHLLHTTVYIVAYDFGSNPMMPNRDWAHLYMGVPNSSEAQDVTEYIVSQGYGTVPFSQDAYAGYQYPESVELEKEQEVANLAKRGAWGACATK